jgi:hypothetical protein
MAKEHHRIPLVRIRERFFITENLVAIFVAKGASLTKITIRIMVFILHRYIFRELIKVFVLATLALSSAFCGVICLRPIRSR